jgi:hypothetical protein
MTMNKSQGQTLKRTLLDARDNVFAHGHLYVAMSRVTYFGNIVFYVTEDQLRNDPTIDQLVTDRIPTLLNIVYKEVIEELKYCQQNSQNRFIQ